VERLARQGNHRGGVVMRNSVLKPHVLLFCLAAVAGCGLENVFNLTRSDSPRPASTIQGATSWPDPNPSQFSASDGDGNPIDPFFTGADGGAYEVRLPSSKYSMIMVRARVGNMALRALVPFIDEETTLTGVDLDARAITEVLIVEARLSADGQTFKQLTPDAYLGTRKLIRAAFDEPGPTQDLLNMVEAIMAKVDPSSGSLDPDFFDTAVLNPDYTIKNRPVSPSFIARNPFDYTGDGVPDADSVAFDAKLAEVAKLYLPAGCPDPDNIRVVFTVDFNSTTKNGNCASVDRFKWATDKPGKTMFFVGWVHKDSPLQDPAVNNLIGGSTPNQIQMYDDGTNGDEAAGDNIYTITFVIPRGDPAAGSVFRIGYKFTWGTRGAPWTGSEEWPGNSRILEVVDVNVPGDGFVYRHEVFGDEATNKDASNLNSKSTGTITWTTDLHGCGPEARENSYDFKTCACGTVQTPKGIGPINVACE
jgi:hypothetical protein